MKQTTGERNSILIGNLPEAKFRRTGQLSSHALTTTTLTAWLQDKAASKVASAWTANGRTVRQISARSGPGGLGKF
jgi:hypothetical protein